MTERLFPELEISLDALRALQLQRLKQSLAHAYAHQKPYRAKCEAAGIHPDDLKSLDDLGRFPFTEKGDLRDAYPFGMFAIPREKCVRVHASSGTTGRPTVVGYSAKDIETWAEVMARSMYVAGTRPGDIVTTPMATACSPAGWAPTTAPSGWAAPWCRCRAASA